MGRGACATAGITHGESQRQERGRLHQVSLHIPLHRDRPAARRAIPLNRHLPDPRHAELTRGLVAALLSRRRELRCRPTSPSPASPSWRRAGRHRHRANDRLRPGTRSRGVASLLQCAGRLKERDGQIATRHVWTGFGAATGGPADPLDASNTLPDGQRPPRARAATATPAVHRARRARPRPRRRLAAGRRRARSQKKMTGVTISTCRATTPCRRAPAWRAASSLRRRRACST